MTTIRKILWPAAVAFLAVAMGCSDDKETIVYVERALYNDPPDAASGFLGYLDPAQGETTCGQCHAGKQAEWEGSGHADALFALENSGHAQDFCYGCHTVSENGNALRDPSGYNVVKTDVYHNVQCENCHGPGLEHVQNPGVAQPLPSLAVPVDGSRLGEAVHGCAECHSGSHHPFAEEWARSAHGNMNPYPQGRDGCADCHRGQQVLEAWGVDAEYLEKDSSEHMPITCGVCHDPHDSEYGAQLRFPIDTESTSLHLCARCHDRRSAPDPTSGHGLHPHAPQTALIEGNAGWFPPGLEIALGSIVPTHGSAANAGLCASCHVNQFTVTDQETGSFLFQSTGHQFNALPCVDAQGIPIEGDCEFTVAARSFAACSQAGCHGSESIAEGLLSLRMMSIQSAADDLLALLEQADPGLEDPDEPIDPDTDTFTVAEGAYFNYNLATFGGDVAGASMHNPFLVQALLDASIVAVEDEYNLRMFPVDKYRQRLAELTGQHWSLGTK